MHEVLVNRLGSLSLPRKSVVRLTDRPNMTLDVYRGRTTTTQQQQHHKWLPVETVYAIPLPVKTLAGSTSCGQSQQEAIFEDNSLNRIQEIADCLGQKPNMLDSLGRKQQLAD